MNLVDKLMIMQQVTDGIKVRRGVFQRLTHLKVFIHAGNALPIYNI